MIDHLPRNSFYRQAMLNDPDVAEQLLELPDQEYREFVAEWSPEREALAQVVDAVHAVAANVIAAAGAKPPRLQPAKRPKTAMDDIRDQRAMSKHLSLVSRIVRPD